MTQYEPTSLDETRHARLRRDHHDRRTGTANASKRTTPEARQYGLELPSGGVAIADSRRPCTGIRRNERAITRNRNDTLLLRANRSCRRAAALAYWMPITSICS